jgi:putative ABC transport system permease protein
VLSGFAGVALLLAALGVYGMLAKSMSSRTREIGVRMALGAQPADVLRLVIRQGLRPTMIGTALGIVAAVWAGQALRSMLYGVTATDPMTFAGVIAVLGVVALMASYIPARRAATVDPMSALRHE